MKKSKLLNGSLAIMILITASKLLGLIRDSLIAKSFGLSYLNDIYSFSIGTTMLFISISYGITAALLPIHTNIKEAKDIKERNRFINNTINITLFFTLLVVLLGEIGAGAIVSIFASSFKADIEIYNQAILLVRIMFLSLLFVGAQSIITSVLQSHDEFIVPSSMPIFSNAIYIFYLVFFIDTFGLNGFGVATVLGFLSMLLVNIPTFKKLGYKYQLVFNFKDENIKRLGRSMIPIIICSSLVQINVFIVRGFAGSLEYGSISSLDYANKLNMLVYEIFAQAISMVIYPTLARHIARKNYIEFKSEIVRGVNLIFLLMIPGAIGLLVLREPLITLYLKRGSFGDMEVLMTSSALLFYIPTMVIYGMRDVLNRGFFSLNESKLPMYNAGLNILLNIVFCYFAIGNLGIRGLALANSLATFFATVILMLTLSRKTNGLDFRRLFISFIKITASSALMGLTVYILNNIIIKHFEHTISGSLISVIVSALIGASIYGLLLYILKEKEFLTYIKMIFNRGSKSIS
ncbi:murein biosynthesis integral membrane protein MurJ [Clostridium cellulovorans]|uniref:Probable lipid II flippase MurJ n=1 Tax=Clostridium cellulovorans (strain ATCC 35296 / DSM 3052 / OCM 3 / 743B) TaxID=573061 RepID=D9SMZ1_CLOC7|nr:murein biosynthesis integral membrane protein MurJ [Clostridium cellulovorans]ADL51857.1 integral membrane protein MviN [Clostridium cellulovorans 743B]